MNPRGPSFRPVRDALYRLPFYVATLLFAAGLFVPGVSLAGSYPATGTQNFSYADGARPGVGTWNDGSALSGTVTGDPPEPVASVRGGALRLTADGVPNTVSSFKIPDLDPGQDIGALTVGFTVKMKAAGAPGRGFSVSFGDIPDGDGDGELGFSPPGGLEIAWETAPDPEAGGAPGRIVVYANRAKVAEYPQTFTFDDTFRAVNLQWSAANGLNLTWNGVNLAQGLEVPGFTPTVGNRLAFSARTGEEVTQETAIDSLRVSTTPAAAIVTGGPVITEFIADNKDSYEDEDMEASDWLEIYNGSNAPVAMGGWHLTDDPANLTKWTLPAFTLNANAYRVIFASGKDRTSPSGVLHTNFSLSKSKGWLALVRPDLTIASEYTYGPQVTDVSYGEVGASRVRGYLETPTPGAKNVSRVAEGPPAEAPVFSREGGLLAGADPVVVSIAPPAAPGAVVRYSLTQTPPTELSPVYSEPFTITNTTTIRARVFEPGKLPGPLVSRTFLKLDSSLTNYSGTGEVFSSNLPVIVFDSFGVNVDATSDPSGPRPYRPTYAVVIPPDPATGRARLDGPVDYQGRSGTHVRGESSSGFAQKSYAWETWDEWNRDKNVSILGLPSESDWVLHGPYSDKTLMRNHLVYSAFQEARGDWFAPRTKFVEVFFNQQANQPVSYADYKGVYLLVEKIKRDRNRVNIAKINSLVSSQPAVTGGYIFKKDKPTLGATSWTSSRGVELQSNTPDSFTPAQLNYLRGYVNSFEAALNGSNYTNPTTGYAAWIDTDTFIDWQLAVEMTKQIDGYVFSTYFHKDRGGKMRAGPLWDFNIALGNADYGEGEYPTGWDYDATRTAPLSGQLWFPRLLSDPNYKMATFDRYWELRRGIWSTEAMMARIDAVSELLRDGKDADVTNNTPASAISPIARHFRKYPILGTRQWPNPASATQRRTFQAEVEYMKSWLTERLAWIDNQYGVLSTAARPPVLATSDAGGGMTRVSIDPFAGTVPGVNFPKGTLYYTTDGSDPRPSGAAMPTSSNVTILPEYGDASWLVPTEGNGGVSLPMEAWTGLAEPPNAAAWTSGRLGIGFEAQPTSSTNPFKYYLAGSHAGDNTWTGGTSNLEASMRNVSPTVFVRVPFTLTPDQRARLVRLQLKIRYDDGFIAYVNGVEAVRQNVKATTIPAWDAVADDVPANFTDSRGATGVTLDISHVIQHLQPGDNMLAILVLNRSVSDDDLLCSPSLLGALGNKPASQPAPVSTAYTGPFTVPAGTTVKTRLFVPEIGLWSPLTASWMNPGVQPASKDNLVISEINYAPLPPTEAEKDAGAAEAADFEFIEFLNTSTETVDLTNVRLTGAVEEFNFSSGAVTTLPPGGRVVVCGSLAAFKARYGENPEVKVAGEFVGNLNNSGETITLLDRSGAVIWSFTYSNSPPWPVINDGLGGSIVLNNPARHPAPDPANGANWRASASAGGAPGLPDAVPFTGNATADSDGDGCVDLLEYVFGTDPANASSWASLSVVVAPEGVRLEFPRSSQADGYEARVEISEDLVNWSPQGGTFLGARRDVPGRVIETWAVPSPSGSGSGRFFYRLKVSLP